jgi:4'-phosphopantetheinyl transferase
LSKKAIDELAGPTATLWLLDGSCVHDGDLDFFSQRLSASERYRYARFVRRERQRQFLLSRALLRMAAARVTGLSPDVFDVIERPGNAPELTVPAGRCLVPHFSLAHSRDWIGCAVSSNARVGLDVEVMDPSRDVLPGSRLAFHPEEYAWLLRQPKRAQLSAFYELWCSREALYKLSSALKRETGSLPLLSLDGSTASNRWGWHRYSLPRSALAVVVCSDQNLSEIEQIELNGLARADWLLADQRFFNFDRPR